MTDSRAIALIMALRGQGISDHRVLAAIERTPRDVFVEEAFASDAYENRALPIACGQTISQPYVVAYMTQVLEVGENMRVLEIGTGSGYQSAVLSPLCRRLYTIERHRHLFRAADAKFRRLKFHNIVTKLGDGFQGWPEQAPFDRIIVTAAVTKIPNMLIEQLKPAGILIAPVGESADRESFSQTLTKIIKLDGGVKSETLIPVVFVPMLPGVPQEAQKRNGTEESS
ncbi:MAG TPA: protein-L-isoaspartate(D-aspartate) O-methyltransferase [Rhizomicrobium sp.]|nr:protein-L-isoaspartate(D-aspartate) O-methyltransferase [Rhizomicrobium sp.]